MGYGKLAKGITPEEAKRKLEQVMPATSRKKDFQGASPPSVFIGSHDYPKVNTGILSLYQEVREIGNSVLELPEEEMEHRLEHEFGFGLPENNYHVSSGNDFQRASFGISYLLADSYAESDQSLFYSERADDFQEFIEELGGHSSGYNTDHLIQYHSLYRSIAEEEGLDVSRYPGDNLVLQRKEDIAEEVLEMLSDMSNRLDGEEKEALA